MADFKSWSADNLARFCEESQLEIVRLNNRHAKIIRTLSELATAFDTLSNERRVRTSCRWQQSSRTKEREAMNEHTKEPWRVELSWITGSDGKRITCPTACMSRDDDENEANERRIVACVNACAGIPLDWLESGLTGCLQNVRDERDMYKRRSEDSTWQCYELMDVLKDAQSAIATCGKDYDYVMGRINAALAKVKK